MSNTLIYQPLKPGNMLYITPRLGFLGCSLTSLSVKNLFLRHKSWDVSCNFFTCMTSHSYIDISFVYKQLSQSYTKEPIFSGN